MQKMAALSPPARKRRHGVQDIMDATEHALATKTAKKLRS
jgi:hypothetical protein